MAKGLNDIPFEDVPFESRLSYSRTGDCLFVYLEDVDSYRDRIDGILTVYRAFDDKRVVGCQIKGLAALLTALGEFGIEYEQQGVTITLGTTILASNILAHDAQYPEDARRELYSELARQAGKYELPELV